MINFSKNKIEILKIIATTNEPCDIKLISKENRKKDQNNWTYLNRLDEAGHIKKISFGQKDPDRFIHKSKDSAGKRIRYRYELKQETIPEIIPYLKTFPEFAKMAFVNFKKSGKKEIARLEDLLINYELEHLNIDRHIILCQVLRERMAFCIQDPNKYYFGSHRMCYFDIVYQIATDKIDPELYKVKKNILKKLSQDYIIKKNPNDKYQITLAGLYWIFLEINKIFSNIEYDKNLDLDQNICPMFHRDVYVAIDIIGKCNNEKDRVQKTLAEQAVARKKWKPPKTEDEKKALLEENFDFQLREYVFPYTTAELGGGSFERAVGSNALLQPIIDKNLQLFPSIFKNWKWLRNYFNPMLLIQTLMKSFGDEVKSTTITGNPMGFQELIDDFKNFLGLQTYGIDKESEEFEKVEGEIVEQMKKKRGIIDDQKMYFNKSLDPQKIKWDELYAELENLPAHQANRHLRGIRIGFVNLDSDDPTWHPHYDEIKDELNNLLSFPFIIELFHHASFEPGIDYDKYKKEFFGKPELTEKMQYWENKLGGYNKIKEEIIDKFWNRKAEACKTCGRKYHVYGGYMIAINQTYIGVLKQ